MSRKNNTQKKKKNQGYTTMIISLEILVGIILSFIASVAFVFLAQGLLQDDFNELDSILSHALYDIRTPWLTEVMFIITLFGAELALMIAGIVFIFFVWWKKWHEALLLFAVLLMAGASNLLLKEFFQRPRPEISPLYLADMYSFPSGHTMTAFVLYALLAYFFYHFTHRKKRSIFFVIGFSLFIFLIGISRVYLGVHYPIDVLAGLFGGLWVFATAMVIERTLLFFHLFSRSERMK